MQNVKIENVKAKIRYRVWASVHCQINAKYLQDLFAEFYNISRPNVAVSLILRCTAAINFVIFLHESKFKSIMQFSHNNLQFLVALCKASNSVQKTTKLQGYYNYF